MVFEELNNDDVDRAVLDVTGVRSDEWIGKLRSQSPNLKLPTDFPVESIRACAAIEHRIGRDPASMLRFYVWLASGCLTTAFAMTQRNAALRRIETSTNENVKDSILARIQSGDAFTTVGISHLTTSRRHVSQPPMRATRTEQGWLLDGYCPWVTGGDHATWLVVGAVECDSQRAGEPVAVSREMLLAIPRNRPGVMVEAGMELVALTGSSTGAVLFENVIVTPEDVLHGPVANVMSASSGATGAGGAGGLQTSALAIGLSAQAIGFLSEQAKVRVDLENVAGEFQRHWRTLFSELLAAGRGEAVQDAGCFRKSANDLALNSTQAALAAAKGAGYTAQHDVGRWCKEALFFLVWSCPQSVVQSHMCSFVS